MVRREEEAELEKLKNPDMPLQESQLGVAAKQMAMATANNMAKLDRNTRNQLLQSIAAFDASEKEAS